MRLNFSGKQFDVVAYHVDGAGLVDMAEVESLAKEHRPKVIIAGWSAYPRQLDFAEFRRIADEVGAYLWSTWPTSRAWSPPVCTRTRSSTRTW